MQELLSRACLLLDQEILNTVEVMREVLLKFSFPVPTRNYTAISKLSKDQGISEALFKCKLLDPNSRGSNSLGKDQEFIFHPQMMLI